MPDFQYQALAEPILPPETRHTPLAGQQTPQTRPVRRRTADEIVFAQPIVPHGYQSLATPHPFPPRPLPRLTPELASLYIPRRIDSFIPGWGSYHPDRIEHRPARVGAPTLASTVAPVAPRPDATEAEAAVYSRNAEYPRPPKRVPQPQGIVAPDLSGDRPQLGWLRTLPEYHRRPRPRLRGTEPHVAPLLFPFVTVGWFRPLELPVRGARRPLIEAVASPLPSQPRPRFFASETVLPNLTLRRLPIQGGTFAPLRQPDPPFVGAENYRPAPLRRLAPQPASPWIPDRQAEPIYFAAPTELAPRFIRRIDASVGETRTEPSGPAVPPLVWFVQHHLPVMLSRRHPEWPTAFADLDRTSLFLDDRDADGASGRNQTASGAASRDQTADGRGDGDFDSTGRPPNP